MSDGAEEPVAGKKTPSVFLERQSYRRRRLMDAARLLPVLGALLFAVPLIWPRAGQPGAVQSSHGVIYIFTVWAVLILGNLWFGHLTRSWSGRDPVDPGREGDSFPPAGG
ncbi:hypothetical protein [Pseudodonghicola xiamenensis]|uniref:Transmembrane protein n=1 Tax=Pseudodonghicola xiamenensis TaxID=337702 RepID=A0A8J3H8Z0_9RHOB|nr:hypothetical protein [Pseudodonghicola xiamenensis]GHH01994.1 hypothetical protein GCM10010961_39580 [Pseudodonghicola xiamenensis]